MANVQISQELFTALCKYHLLEMGDDAEFITKSLQNKLDALVDRDLYSKSKNKALTASEREKARQEYLDRKGIPHSFRW